MDRGLKGRVAVITGSSRGIGRAAALAFAREGASVVLCARGASGMEQVTAEIRRETGGRALGIACDALEPASARRIVDETMAAFGRLDVLVNNVARTEVARYEDLSPEHWRDHLSYKLLPYIRLANEALPHMRRQRWGRIINISGTSALDIFTHMATIGLNNAATVYATKLLADAVAKENILVNVICPGPIDTERQTDHNVKIGGDEGRSLDRQREDVVSRIPMGRMGRPEEVADLILFLASERAGFITGACYVIDGGMRRAAH